MFEKTRIVNAINKAFQASQEGNKIMAQKITESVMEQIMRIHRNNIPTVEDIQDLVEKKLIENNFSNTAKLYILYREEHAKARAEKQKNAG